MQDIQTNIRKLETWQIAYADMVNSAQDTGSLSNPVSELYQNCSVLQAYEIQDYNVSRWVNADAPVAGYKIGLTSKNAQESFGIDSPVYARLFPQMVWENMCRKCTGRLNSPVLEVEIAFYISHDIRTKIVDCADLIPYIDTAHIAFEIVSGRLSPLANCAVDLIADNCGATGIVIGEGTSDTDILATLSDREIELFCDNILIQKANTKNVLGSPLLSLMWLANKLIDRGECLRKGQVVMAGSATAGVAIAAGMSFTAKCEPLGIAKIDFCGE